jgi:hypothetical protein
MLARTPLRISACKANEEHKTRAKEFAKKVNNIQMQRADSLKMIKKDIFADIREIHLEAIKLLNLELTEKIKKEEKILSDNEEDFDKL